MQKAADYAGTREEDLRLMVITQANAKGEQPLENVPKEAAAIRASVRTARVLMGEYCAQELVLLALKPATWVHIACHAHQDRENAFNSRFALNQSFTLTDIVKLKLPEAEMAFLSACHTAAGDVEAPDEALHLAAGMMLAGVRSVVGTMWACADEDGPVVAEAFYKYMLRNGPEFADHRESAAALAQAVRELRQRGVPLERWICYVHYGL